MTFNIIKWGFTLWSDQKHTLIIIGFDKKPYTSDLNKYVNDIECDDVYFKKVRQMF